MVVEFRRHFGSTRDNVKITVNNRYKILQGLFWMLFCVSFGFISLYLQGRGLSDAGIGIVTAVSGILAAILQPLLGGITDRSNRLTWRSMILLLCIPFLLVCILMPLIPGPFASAVLVGILILISNTTIPFVNSAHYYYTQAGEYVNFSVARGIGSGSFAVMALVIGGLAARFGIEMVPITGIFISLLFIFVVFRMPMTKEPVEKPPRDTKQMKGFLLRYPTFTLMLIASLLMFTTHNILNTFLLQIIQSLGGNSSQLGIALAIQAVVEVPVLFGFSLLIKRFTPKSLMLTAAFGFALKALLYALSGSVMMIYLIQFTQMISFALFASSSVFYTSQVITKEDQTSGQAYMTSTMAAGTVLGGLIGGWLLELSSIKIMLSVNIIIALMGVGFAFISVRNQRPNENT